METYEFYLMAQIAKRSWALNTICVFLISLVLSFGFFAAQINYFASCIFLIVYFISLFFMVTGINSVERTERRISDAYVFGGMKYIW